MKVLSLVSYPFLPARVGGQKFIASFNERLAQFAQLTCVTTRNNDVAEARGYEVRNILPDSAYRYVNPFSFFTLKKLIQSGNITHLVLEHPYFGWLGILLKKATDVKLVVHSHNIEGLRWKSLGKWWWKILWKYERRVHRQADFSFFITQEDRDYAIKNFRVEEAKSAVITYGIDSYAPPTDAEKETARNYLLKKYNLSNDCNILLFNGAFGYLPNRKGLEILLQKVNPLLEQAKQFNYALIICGKDIPNELVQAHWPNVIFAGFVEDIYLYFKGADVFVNPVISGGGIKTKLVEALGAGSNAVSTQNGAFGVDPALCNGKLAVINNDDWNGFAGNVIRIASNRQPMPKAFYDHFYWDNIAREAFAALNSIGQKKAS